MFLLSHVWSFTWILTVHIFLGVFVLLQAVAALKYLQNFLTKSEFKVFFIVSATIAAGVVLLTIVGLTWAGVIAPWSGRYVTRRPV